MDAPQHLRSAVRVGQIVFVGLGRGGRGGSITATAHTTADTAHTTAGNNSATETPWLSASRGITKAPNPTPSGWAVCRMPITRPRCSGGNHPTTNRPLAELLLAAAIPPSSRNAPTATSESHRCRRERRGRSQRRTQGQHDPLADPVDDVAPRDQRGDHAEARHRRQQTGLREIEPAFVVQGGNEKGRTVDEHVGAQRGTQRDAQHRPAPQRADRGGGHGAIVAQRSHDAELSFHIVRWEAAASGFDHGH